MSEIAASLADVVETKRIESRYPRANGRMVHERFDTAPRRFRHARRPSRRARA